MKFRVRVSLTRLFLLVVLLSFSSTDLFGQSVSGYVLGKIQNFRQTSIAAPVVDTAQPFQFGAILTPGTATINSATLTFSGTASPRTFTDQGGVFTILDTFTTQGQLDAAYSIGNYTVNVNTSVGDLSSSVFLLPLSYPVTAPLTVPTNDWQNGAIVIDPSVDYIVTWGPFSNANSTDVIQFAVRNSVVIPPPLAATETSFTIPAGSLTPNTDYSCDLAFVRVAGANTGGTDIGPGFATLAKDTGFMIHTTAGKGTPTPTPVPTATATPSATGTPSATATATPSPTASPEPTASPTPTNTPVPSPTPSGTPGPTPTATATVTPVPTPTASPSVTPTASPTPTPGAIPGRALNISTRLQVETGNNILIGGFIVTTEAASKSTVPNGAVAKEVAIRGIGPSLGAFGVTNPLANPTLQLANMDGVISTNDNWQDNANQAAQLTDLGLALSDPSESGIVADLVPGAYTALLSGVSNGTGVGLMEIYDVAPASPSQLSNISTRGVVQTGSGVMIGGFIIGGTVDTHVVVRGIGPSLADFGLSPVLPDPILELHDSNGATLVTNDDWQDDPTSAAQLSLLGLAPTNAKESGIYTSLPPGAFTAVLAGINSGTGIGLIEIYNLH